MARPVIKVSQGRRPARGSGLRPWRADCPDCRVTAVHSQSVLAVAVIAEHGETEHGWTEKPNVRGK